MIFREIVYPDDPYTEQAAALMVATFYPNKKIANNLDELLDMTAEHHTYCVEPDGGGDDKQPLAYGSFREFMGTVEIDNVVVVPELRRNGIGRFLICHLEEEIDRQFGGAVIQLTSKLSAIEFYLKLGYQLQGPGSGTDLIKFL